MINILINKTVSFTQLTYFAFIFVGTSFITDHTGAVLQQADRFSSGVIVAELNLTQCSAERAAWGLFRDRRPELYGPLLTKDGRTRPN